MTIPKSVVVGPHTVTVRSDPDTCLLLREDGKSGDSLKPQLVIRVDTTCPHTTAADTLLHEVLHHIWDITSLRLGDNEREERVISALSPLLLDVLRRNPTLVTYLTAKEPT